MDWESFETKKILGMPDLLVSATAVRVPVLNGHSESVWVEFEEEYSLENITNAIKSFHDGLIFDNGFPTPVTVSGKREVFIGRVRIDPERPTHVHFWIVADNLRKGAATNAVQIAEYICQHNLI